MLALTVTIVSLAAAAAPRASPSPTPTATPAPQGFRMLRIAMYQQEDVVQARLVSVDELALYVKKLDETSAAVLADVKAGAGLDVVVAVKPGRRVRTWLLPSSPAVPGAARLAELKKQLEALPAPEVRQGPFAFAMIGAVGAVRRPRDAALDLPPPLPREWRQAVRSKPGTSVPDGVLAVVWPDEPAR